MCTEPDQCRRQATTIFLSLNQSFTDGVACFRRSQNFDQRKPAVAVANPNEAQGFFGLGQGRLREGLDPRFGCQKLSAGLRDLEFVIGAGNCFPRRRGAKPRFGSASWVPWIAIGWMGRPDLMAISKAPGLKRRIRPDGERVPSGNIMIELPLASASSHARIIWTTLARSPRFSLM